MTGNWRVTAISEVPTPSGLNTFNFGFAAPFASAQFGCNTGSAPARVENGWFVSGGWVITTGGCDEQRMRLERPGFDILSKPLFVQPTVSGGVRLRNERGSIVLERQASPQLAGTQWRVLSINDVPPARAGIGSMRFTVSEYRATFGCNDINGGYRLEGVRFLPSLSRMTERGCELVPPTALSVMTYEDWGVNILWGGGVTVTHLKNDQLRFENAKGVILLQRVQ
ncbi:MAG: META domain-containing protein [Sphingomonas sp.]|nr:META domain-containing protein [Sphingomonas sp.]